jgi:hypothetical protein
MESHLNSHEEQLFDLIESKDYDALTASEKVLVDRYVSETEFTTRRTLLKNAAIVFEDEPLVVPKPLIIRPEKPATLLNRSIPLYQVLLAAAVITLLILVIPFNRAENEHIQTEYIVQHDTVEVEKLVHDTVISIREKKVPVEKIVYVPDPNSPSYTEDEPRLFEPGSGFELPPLQPTDLTNA